MKYIALIVAAVLVGIDQLVKYIVDTNMALHQTFPIIQIGDTHVFNITYERNTGAAFSILEGKQIFLIVLTSVVIIALLWYLLSGRAKSNVLIWTISLILSGGIGNLIDRLTRGFVVDFFDFKLIGFAVFNIADICAVVGSVGLMLYVIVNEIRTAKQKKDEDDATDSTDTVNQEE